MYRVWRKVPSDAIDAAKPYKGGNDELWVLHRLDIADKHHALLTTVTGLPNVSFYVVGNPLDPGLSFGAFSFPGIKGLVEGEVFFTRKPEVHKDVSITFECISQRGGSY